MTPVTVIFYLINHCAKTPAVDKSAYVSSWQQLCTVGNAKMAETK